MPYNGSGTFTLYSPGNPVVTGTTISSTWANNTLTDLATGLSTALTKDGQTTPTANIPMGGFKLTGLGAGTTNGDAIRWQQSAAGVMTTLGDTLYASAANTPARLAAKADVAAHATTSDPWVAREVVLTGSAVTFTDIADAPYVGAEVWIYQNAAHTWTNGATFVIQGGANYTAAAGDWIRLYATTVSTFQITIFPFAGTSTAASKAEQEAASSTSVFVSPGRQQYHPSACKGWIEADAAGSATAAYNVASITDEGTGLVQVTWTTAFSSATTFTAVVTARTDSSMFANLSNSITDATKIRIVVRNDAGTLSDPDQYCGAAFGDQ